MVQDFIKQTDRGFKVSLRSYSTVIRKHDKQKRENEKGIYFKQELSECQKKLKETMSIFTPGEYVYPSGND